MEDEASMIVAAGRCLCCASDASSGCLDMMSRSVIIPSVNIVSNAVQGWGPAVPSSVMPAVATATAFILSVTCVLHLAAKLPFIPAPGMATKIHHVIQGM